MSDQGLCGVLAVLFCFFFPNLLFLILGLIFYRFKFSHKFGIRCLAMCMLVKKDFIASKCKLDCGVCACGNWTCSKYSQPKTDCAACSFGADQDPGIG